VVEKLLLAFPFYVGANVLILAAVELFIVFVDRFAASQ
jgi:hypothetical protein